MFYLTTSVLFLLAGVFQFYRTREPFWKINIGLGVVMVSIGLIDLLSPGSIGGFMVSLLGPRR
jgi:hypothetical protein